MKPLHQIMPSIMRKQPRRASSSAGTGAADPLFAEDLIRSAWTHLAGKQLASRTRPLRIYGDTLIVEVPDRAWPRELRRFEGALLDRVNRLLGQTRVCDVQWRVNPALAEPPAPEPPRKPPARETDAALEAAARAIPDPELRELFVRIARKMAK